MKRKPVLGGLGISLLVAAFLSPLASSFPDGLERVAEDTGFLEKAQSLTGAPMPDYLFPGVAAPGPATALAGIAGVLATFLLVWGLARLLKLSPK